MSMDTQTPPSTMAHVSSPKTGAPVVLENLTRRFGTTKALPWCGDFPFGSSQFVY